MRRDILLNIDISKTPTFNREFSVRNGDSLRLNVCMFQNDKILRIEDKVIRAYVRKSDGSLLMQKEGIDILSENEFEINLKNSATNVSGLCYMEIEIQDSVEASVLTTTNPILFEVEDRIGNVEKAITAIDDIYLVGEIEKFIAQAKIDIALLKEQIEKGLLQIEEFNNFVIAKTEELEQAIEEAINSIDFGAQDYLSKVSALCEDYGFKIVKLGDTYLEEISNKSGEVLEVIDAGIEEVQKQTEYSKVEIHNLTKSHKFELNSFAGDKKSELEATGKEQVELIEATGSNVLADITGKEEEILGKLDNITVNGTEMLGEAIKAAEKRLQEETIKATWEVQQKSKEEQDNIASASTEARTEISEYTELQKEAIQKAGADMVELVETLDASIEEGINEIESVIDEGKTDIYDLSSRIKKEGEDIVNMVANLEADIGDGLERIGKAGENSIKSIESATSSSKSEIQLYTNEKKEEVNTAGDEKLQEINNILGVNKGEVEELLSTTRAELQSYRAEISERVNTGVEEITELKDNSLEEMASTKDACIEEILGAEIALKEDFTTLRDEIINQIDTKGDTTIETLENMIDTIDRLQEKINDDLEASYTRAEILDDKLENVDNKMTEIQPTINMLNEIRNLCAQLVQERQIADTSIETLQFLHTESDVRIVELRRLIELAKEYEEVVKRWIENRVPAENLDEVNGQLEELYTGVNTLFALFTNYYTIEQTDEFLGKIDNDITEINEEIEKLRPTFKGFIGTSVKVASIPVGAFDGVPEPPEVEGATYIGKIMYKYPGTYNTMYKVEYLYDNHTKKYYPYLYLNTNIAAITGGNLSSTYGTLISYERNTNSTTSNWSDGKINSTIYVERNDYEIYYHDVPIYGDKNKSNIYRESTDQGYISNLDMANESGEYLIEVSQKDYKTLQNAPKVSLISDLKAILFVRLKGNEVFQEVTIGGTTYTRTVGKPWISVDTSNLVKKSKISTIKGAPIQTLESYEDIYADCPVPNTHNNIVGQIDFRIKNYSTELFEYYRIYTMKSTNNEMFYIYKNGTATEYIGYTGGWSAAFGYRYINNGWESYKNTSGMYVQAGLQGYTEIYLNTLPICSATSTSKPDKTNIIKEAMTGEEEVAIYDFNNATEYGVYEVNVEENTSSANTPIIEPLKGVLKVVKLEDRVYQELLSDDKTVYKRECLNGEWSEWTSSITPERVSEIVDEKTNEVIEDVNELSEGFNALNNVFGNIPANAQRFDYTNADGMIESYNWIDLNGFKIMWINVKLSEDEYNSGSGGLMMKTLNFPDEVKIFNNIIMANITSYCREGNNTLSRIVQNAEVISNVSVRGRWRHTDNTYPRIDNFTILCWGM